jgi:hypothetical protein
MRAVRFTKAEVAALMDLDRAISFGDFGNCTNKHWDTLVAKVTAACEPAAKGANVAPIQEALIAAARGKVIALEGQYGRASRQCGDMGVTPESAQLVGEWMARQGWLHGPMTLLDVLNKWGSWLAKAKATAPPPGLEPGFGKQEHPGGGASPAGKATPGGRSPSGFR